MPDLDAGLRQSFAQQVRAVRRAAIATSTPFLAVHSLTPSTLRQRSNCVKMLVVRSNATPHPMPIVPLALTAPARRLCPQMQQAGTGLARRERRPGGREPLSEFFTKVIRRTPSAPFADCIRRSLLLTLAASQEVVNGPCTSLPALLLALIVCFIVVYCAALLAAHPRFHVRLPLPSCTNHDSKSIILSPAPCIGCGHSHSLRDSSKRHATSFLIPTVTPVLTPCTGCRPPLPQVQRAWRIFFPERPKRLTPREDVKQRLRMILVADRCGMSPASMSEMKKTICKARRRCCAG